MANVPSVTLNNGRKMPIIGLGTYVHKGDREKQVFREFVKDAIAIGYRHVDTAQLYENEEGVGQAIKESIEAGIVTRDQVFVTTKLHIVSMAKENVVPSLRESLVKLQLDYVDLFLIHWPVALAKSPLEGGDIACDDTIDIHNGTWKAMEECVKLGLAKSIGVSNYNSKQLQETFNVADIMPAVNQVESHPLLSQRKLLDFCNANGVALTAYSPLGGSPPPDAATAAGLDLDIKKRLFTNDVVNSLASKYNKSVAQILLKYQAQRDIIVIPKSASKSRAAENIDIFDFDFTQDELDQLEQLNENARYIKPEQMRASKNYPFDEEF
ncbi:Aldo-keto reductase family 1 member A1 [Halotydeus destructor]|nr:Aldo-keto reductase family 1 member A1 [Halotydeus destructor]